MPRQRSPNRDRAFDIYREHNGDITNRQIAEILNENEKTIAVWKQRDKWSSSGNVVQQKKKSCTTKRTTTKRNTEKENEKLINSVLENPELNDKQRLFCLYFSKCFNATKAYQKAYGCSYETAGSNGYSLLQKTEIQAEIQRLKRAKLNQAMLEPEDIFQKYMDIAFADITDFVEFGQEEVNVMADNGPVQIEDEETGEKVPLMQKVSTVRFKDSSNVDGTIISEIKHGRNGTSIKLADRMKALQWLSDHMDLATDEQKARIGQIKAQTERLQVVEKETDEAVEKLDQILKEVRDNAIKQKTE